MHFYKNVQHTIDFKDQKFKRAFVNDTGYDPKMPQIERYAVMSNRKATVETGFLTEAYATTLQELLQSEHVWAGEVPINPTTRSLTVLNRRADGLINYSIDFEYAYDEINNV